MVKEKVKEIEKELIELITSDFDEEDRITELTEKTNIVTEFLLNSVDALELLLKIEEKFDIEIPDESLNIDLLQNVENLSEFIYKLQTEG